MAKRIGNALVPALAVVVGMFAWLAGQVPNGDWSRVGWVGISGQLGFGLFSALVAAPVSFVALGLTSIAPRLRA